MMVIGERKKHCHSAFRVHGLYVVKISYAYEARSSVLLHANAWVPTVQAASAAGREPKLAKGILQLTYLVNLTVQATLQKSLSQSM